MLIFGASWADIAAGSIKIAAMIDKILKYIEVQIFLVLPEYDLTEMVL